MDGVSNEQPNLFADSKGSHEEHSGWTDCYVKEKCFKLKGV